MTDAGHAWNVERIGKEVVGPSPRPDRGSEAWVGKYRLLREIARDHSVVVVEHDMNFVRDLGVKVTVLHEGAVLAEGPLDVVSANPRVIEVYLGR